MIQIIAVHIEGGNGHEHISQVRWVDLDNNNKPGTSTVAEMVQWIEEGGKSIVRDEQRAVYVGVVDADPKYIRTHADGVWTNNLLALPHF